MSYPLTYMFNIPPEFAESTGFNESENWTGRYVKIPFRNKTTRGVIVGIAPTPENPDKIKEVIEVVEELQRMSAIFLKFLEWVADYNMAPIGMLARTAIPAGALEPLKKSLGKVDYDIGNKNILSKQQAVALAAISPSFQQKLGSMPETSTLTGKPQARNNVPVLLDGVTGSGKTEVYLEAIAQTLEQGGQALVLLPEIALSVQMTERFAKRFGVEPAVWHSQMTTVQRQRTWQGIATGKISIVIGARSGLFLPFKNLGIIIIDEEHDGTYKQEEQIIYNARDMAIVRGQMEQAKVVLVSATPSLETLHNVALEKYATTHLPQRHYEVKLPQIHLIDLREQKLKSQQWLSLPLLSAIEETLAKQQQALLFLNRRGYAPLTLCRDCGFRWQCPSCSAWLVRHEYAKGSFLQCHHCGYGGRMPKACPQCEKTENIVSCGPGIEQLTEQIKNLYPNHRVLMLSSDAMQNRKQAKELLDQIHNNQVDILVGTQVIAKGHHFPNLNMVGIVDGDASLTGGDPRAAEKTWQLLHQVAGRAGREHLQGHVYIQTALPDHPVMQTLKQYDRDGFIAQQNKERQDFQLPPYYRLAAITLKAKKEQDVVQYAQQLIRHAPVQENMRILGPAPALMYRLHGFYRMRFLLRCSKSVKIQNYITKWLPGKFPNGIKAQVDIDPYTFF